MPPSAGPALPGVSRAIEGLDVMQLREAIREEYSAVATDPSRGFHFHTGRRLAAILGYEEAWLADVPEDTVAAFAGTGNPFSLGAPLPGEHVVDVGCGAGIDSLIAARMVGPTGAVVGVDMTPAMLERARSGARQAGFGHVAFHQGLAESLPVPDGWADVVISNGVINLCADKQQAFSEIRRVLKPGGYLQFADIANGKPVPASAVANIDLWTA